MFYEIKYINVYINNNSWLIFILWEILFPFHTSLCSIICFCRYQTARGIIDSIFGPKAHKQFPKTRRLKGKGCDGKGIYVSSLENDDDPEYVHKGVDVMAEKGDNVFSIFIISDLLFSYLK